MNSQLMFNVYVACYGSKISLGNIRCSVLFFLWLIFSPYGSVANETVRAFDIREFRPAAIHLLSEVDFFSSLPIPAG